MPLLSIIVPIYNVEKLLSRCIDSILAQTFRDFELILVDDGSPDACGKICDEYAEREKRIRVIHKKNGGLSDARNAGLEIASGKYIGFVDSDDFVRPQMYEKMLDIAHETGAEIVACGIEYVDEDNCSSGTWPLIEDITIYSREEFIEAFFPKTRLELSACVWNKIYVRDIFTTIRFPVDHIYEDTFIQLETYDKCKLIAITPEPFYSYYSSRPDSIMNCHYNVKRLDMITASWTQYIFFVNKNLKKQQEYAMDVYVKNYMLNFFAIYMEYPQYRKMFKPYKKNFNALFDEILSNRKISNMKKLAVIMLYINRKFALWICRKYFPECLPVSLRLQNFKGIPKT